MVLIIVMGVSGCGKSTLGKRIAQRLDIPFIEGDVLHPKTNVDKMSQGIPLDDNDRWPWLTILGKRLAEERQKNGAVLACSALKKSYRDLLRTLAGDCLKFIYVHGEYDVLSQRMQQRTAHFMPVSLLKSQLATLEDPTKEVGVLQVDCTLSEAAAVQNVMDWLKVQNEHQ